MRHWRLDPPQRGPRTITLKHENVREPSFVRVYSAASVSGDRAQVMPSYLLSQILGGGESSRLYQSLVVRQKLASNVGADYDGTAVGPGTFQLYAVPVPGVSLAQIETALDKELETIRIVSVSADELSRAKRLLKAETTYARDGLEEISRTIGSLVMSGLEPDYFTRWPSLIDAVGVEDVLAAAKYSFDADKSVTGYLLPREKPSQAKAEGK